MIRGSQTRRQLSHRSRIFPTSAYLRPNTGKPVFGGRADICTQIGFFRFGRDWLSNSAKAEFDRRSPTGNSGRGNHAGSSRRRGGYPSPKIAAASRQRFVGPPARGGLDGVCGSAFHFWRWVAAICNTRSLPQLHSARAAPAPRCPASRRFAQKSVSEHTNMRPPRSSMTISSR